MNTLNLYALLLLCPLSAVSAQQFHLPVSTAHEGARQAYASATYLAANLRLHEANQAIDQALELEPNFFMAYIFRWQFLQSECITDNLLEKALAIDPTHFTEAEHIMRKQAHIWLKAPYANPAKALAALVAAYPQTPEAYEWAYLQAAISASDFNQAIRYANQLAKLAPDYAPVYHGLGYCYLELGAIEEAGQAFSRYLKLAPTEPNAHDSMAHYYRTTAQYGLAAEHYHEAAALGIQRSHSRHTPGRFLTRY